VTGKEVIKPMERNGCTLVRVRGSLHRLTDGTRHVTVAVHAGQDMPPGTLAKTLEEAGRK
jgi:predicted RNA binding protein YcfA (HicA-like mRNA interferase family)